MKKKILALLLVAVMVIGLLPTTAFAAEDEHDCMYPYWGNGWIVDEPATCVKEGSQHRVCQGGHLGAYLQWVTCGYVETDVIPVDEDAHFDGCPHDKCEHESGDTYTFTVEANCTYKGVIEVYCKDCEELISSQELPTNGNHFFHNGVCQLCGESDECEHNKTHQEIIEANCKTEGSITIVCDDCGEVASNVIVILPTTNEHVFVNGVCKVCGETDECKHDYKVVKEQAADCTYPAYKWYECTLCGAEKNGEEGAPNPTAHNYEVVKELDPTCVEAGYVWKKCSICGAEKNHEQGAATGVHTYEVVKEQAADCTNPAYKWYECSVCGAEKNGEEGAPNPTAHNYEVVKELAPTCVEAGYVWKKCSICGAEKNHEQGAATGIHNYEVVKELAPTCIEAGYVWKECSVCGAEKNHEQGAATGKHVYETVKEEKATCTEPGYVWQECTTPGCDWEKNFETPALGTEHGDTFTFTVEANCTDKGVVKTYCQVCEELIATEELPTNDNHFFYEGKCMKCGKSEACEHADGTYTFTVEANCTDKGIIEVHCKTCEEVISSQELPTNDNHFYYNDVCQLCGAKKECKHDYKVVKEQAADCTYPAYKWYECTLCGAEKNGEEGAPNPTAHNYEVVKELAPTCVEAGYVWKKCSICGNEKNHEQGAATGIHNYEVVKELAPTCVEAGYVWKECSVCGWEKNHEQGEATGVHTYEVVKELAPTCVEAGYVWKECSVCGWEKNHEQGEATGVHTWKKDVTEATCTETGLIQPYCEICGAKSPLSAQTPALGHDVKDGACTRCDYVEPTKPTEPEETTKPSEPEETTKPTEPEETTKPTEPEATTKPTEPEATTKPTEPEATTKPTEKPTEAPTEAPTTKPAETTKPADPALDNVPKTGDNTGMILATMTTIALLSAMAFVFGKKRSVR